MFAVCLDVKYNIMSERIIGSGQFGKVYEGIEVETSKRGLTASFLNIKLTNLLFIFKLHFVCQLL